MTKTKTKRDELIDDIKDENDLPEDTELPIDDLEFETLINSCDEILPRPIQYFDVKKGKKVKANVYVKPISHAKHTSLQNLVSKSKNKSIVDEVVKRQLFDSNQIQVKPETIQKLPSGLIEAIYEEIRIISGLFRDKGQELIARELVKND